MLSRSCSLSSFSSEFPCWEHTPVGERLRLEPVGILKLRRHLGVLRAEAQSPELGLLLNPSLIEREEEVIARFEGPADPSLPTQVSRTVVVLNQIREGQRRRRG